MANPESFSGERPANQLQLAGLYEMTKSSLDRHGRPFVEPRDDIMGLEDGLPIAKENPRLQFKASGKVVRQAVPAAAEMFENDDALELIYWLPHYQPQVNGKDLQLSQPHCTYSITKQGPPVYNAWLDLEFDEHANRWRADRQVYAPDEVDEVLRVSEDQAAELPFIGFNWLNHSETTPSYMTKREYGVLMSIVSSMGIIQAMMLDEPPSTLDV